ERQLAARRSMIETDGPRHRSLRGVLQPEFTPRAVAELADDIAAVVREVLDAVLPLETFDFVDSVASRVPVLLLTRLLALPRQAAALLLYWSDRMTSAASRRHQPVQTRLLPYRSEASREVAFFGRALAGARSVPGARDLVSALVQRPPGDGVP